jgi:hypothetical protein
LPSHHPHSSSWIIRDLACREGTGILPRLDIRLSHRRIAVLGRLLLFASLYWCLLPASSWTTGKVPAACTLCSMPALRQNIVLAPLQPSTVISLPETLLRLRPLFSALFVFSLSSGCSFCGLSHWSWSRFDVSLTLALLLLFSGWTWSITVSFPYYLNMLAKSLTIIDQGVVYTPSRYASSWAGART